MQEEKTIATQARFKVLGINVDAVQIPDVIARIEEWIAERKSCHFIVVTGMHGVIEAQRDPFFKQLLNSADLVVPDGAPLVWLGRKAGYALKRRVYGPELMEIFCKSTGKKYRHFLYGGTDDTLERLKDVLEKRYGLNIAGAYSPPFRPLSPEEGAKEIDLINQANPDVIWVSLGEPKQSRWMYEHVHSLQAPVMVGVGAAFDFLPGIKPQAPRWMREHGLEWLFRLSTEPKRLWKRYLIGGPKFIYYVILERLKIRKFD